MAQQNGLDQKHCVAISSKQDLACLLNSLNAKADDPLCLPVQFTIYSLLNGQLKNVFVFVNQWPDWDVVFCGQDSGECLAISPEQDEIPNNRLRLLYCDFYIPQKRQLLEPKLNDFLRSVFDELSLFERGADFVGLTEALRVPILELITEQLPKITLYDYGPALGCRIYAYKKNTADVEARLPKLADGETLGSLSPGDVDSVVEFWGPGERMPNLRDRLAWLGKFPSGCVRDQNGRPVSWCIVFEDGAKGARYTLPEYRCRGLGRLVSYYALKEFNRRYPEMTLWSMTSHSNEASRKSDAMFIDRVSEELVTVLYFRPADTRYKPPDIGNMSYEAL